MTVSTLLGNAALMRRAMAGEDLRSLGQALLERATRDADDANALMDLSMILQLQGQRELALQVQGQALALRTLYHLPAATRAGAEPSLRLLAFMTPGDLMTNTPLDCLLEQTDVALDMLYLGDGLPLPDELPEHDVLFIAIGASDRTAPLLAELGEVTRDWPRPLLNRPERTAWTARDIACHHLCGAPGIVMPLTCRLPREVLARIGRNEQSLDSVLADGRFPIIARPIDTHAGQGLAKIDEPAGIAGFLAAFPASDNEFHVSRFVDYRDADGLYRKYRVALIDGRPYASHMAVSSHWMIHYLNAGMEESAAKRAEEERFMVGFADVFAPRHAAAFAALHERLGLDYLVIDCAEAPAGGLLIFEVDTGAVVHAMDPVAIYPYKPAQMQKAFTAFRALLAAKCAPCP